MSHQVLARKWRPRTFDSLIGQEHVVGALTHALESGRLHHAYLFTGTRGVGKTTIARILAKAVNCETGMTASPCGECSACTQIDQGGFVDYLELDAASNRGVDEMVQILDNAVYAPTAGRYKVYVIDEVHMLTAHAFNAMLKTLEEPPPHMLFILATTDPQKVPVTVLSRCMQFNLRNMQPQAIAGHLATVLDSEGVTFDDDALNLIGRAAAGSMRDALSLTDQAIAAGAGAVDAQHVRDMLGMIDAQFVEQVLEALSGADGPGLVQIADTLSETPEACARLLTDLASRFADLAAEQTQPGNEPSGAGFSPAELQVYYQIAVYGQRDLPLAPDPRAGLLMSLLRMLAFAGVPSDSASPGEGAAGSQSGGQAANARLSGAAAARAALAGSGKKSAEQALPATRADEPVQPVAQPAARARTRGKKSVLERLVAGEHPSRREPESAMPTEPSHDEQPVTPPPAKKKAPPFRQADDDVPQPSTQAGDDPAVNPARVSGPNGSHPEADTPAAAVGGVDFDGIPFNGDWPALARRIGLAGRPGQFLLQSQLERVDNNCLYLRVPIDQLAEAGVVERVTEALQEHLPGARLSVVVARIDGDTGAIKVAEEREQQLERARASLESDPFVKSLMSDFDAIILPDSVRPIESNSENRRENT